LPAACFPHGSGSFYISRQGKRSTHRSIFARKTLFTDWERKNMKTKSALALCLALLLLLADLPCDARAQSAAPLHLFYGIPLDTATPESVAQTLKEQTGAELSAPNATDTQYYAEDVPWLGKTFGCMVEFYSKKPGIRRIVLHPAGKTIWSDTADEFTRMVTDDIQYYIAMEQLLIGQYGEPDWRFFTTNAKNFGLKAKQRYMFADGQWNAEALADVVRTGKGIRAHTAWGNVVWELWAYQPDKSSKKSKSSLTLYFYDQPAKINTAKIAAFPATAEGTQGSNE